MARNEEFVEDELLDEELEEEEAPAGEGFFDSLSSQFGSAPWWVISGAFHALLLLLLTLIGMAIYRAQTNDVVITTDLEKSKPPEYDEKKPRDVFKNPVPIDSDMPPVENPVVTHEEVEIADHVETENDMDMATAKGDENAISDVPLGGVGTVAAIGLGGGGGGAFGHRLGGGRRRLATRGGGGRATESAVDAALKWLADHQEADGHWDTMKYAASNKTDTACTALALLAFLGAGHTEKVGKYKDNVRRAVSWLISKQQANGLTFDSTDAGGHRGTGYPHSIAGMALAEAAGMGRVPETRAAAQKAIDYTCNVHQQGEGSEKGAWRYQAKSAGDTSVTGWFIMQLKSAKVSGLSVDAGSFEGAIKFLDSVEKKAEGGEYGPASIYWYQPTNPHEHTQHRLTAIGTLGRQFLGWKKEDLEGSVKWFMNKGGVPKWDGGGSVDLYYWYYGTLCVFQQGGDLWKQWNDSMKSALCDNQRKGGDEDGSWDPVGAYANEWGRVGQTALCCLCLEVYYRYLPLYKQ